MVKRAGGSLLLSIQIDHAHHHPVSTQLCVALREMILTGGFAPGDRLPASRTLARDLGVSRTTVVEVFSRLTAEGLIESATGSGTFVSAVLGGDRPMPSRAKVAASEPLAPKLSAVMQEAVSHLGERQRLPHAPRAFTTGLPAFDAFPRAQWARLSAKWLRGSLSDVMGYGDPFGALNLRRALASHLRGNRGITCDPEQIFILGGAQQAFHLIGSMLLNPGDKVWFENPGAIGARNSLIASGADLIPVPVDDHGLCVEEGLRLASRFRLAFVTPSHQQPLGSVMSLARRFALLRAAEDADAWVIEDDYDGEFFFAGRPPPTLKSVDTTGRVIYVGTFSKSIFPALRLGYVLAPPALVATFQTILSRFLQGVPSHTQGVVAEFIDEGHFAVHVRRMRQIYFERHEALARAAQQHLGGLLEVVPAKSGLHTVGYLAPGLSEASVSRGADERGVTVSPLGRFAISPLAVSGLVLGFGSSAPPAIEAGVKVLAEVLRGQRRG
ncbi:transcriptional regulator, GntR family [Polaromonas sp. OV174]|uniref:MocR-like pyridoxine biosynthesis transcription factor PdxR n=1 Tax=Polaromonas sp. OV174 TaxID=1855300 RepID=UPI0008E5B936|nr:PLP-dependent aminotransferase family protein [Polaromonas sp. OV174]SFC70846.1 transcriptional regulator, GntR family [Polaromonas sp. OV174]